nr:defensin-like protein 1 [Ipomoea batatas]
MAKSYTIFLAFIFVFLVATPTESKVGEENVCRKLSKLYTGWCVGGDCDLNCRNIEGAVYGSCDHWLNSGYNYACFCYFNC